MTNEFKCEKCGKKVVGNSGIARFCEDHLYKGNEFKSLSEKLWFDIDSKAEHAHINNIKEFIELIESECDLGRLQAKALWRLAGPKLITNTKEVSENEN